ncbi:DUF58 domain-containing protein [Methanocella sp. MCL-LM]|uniref:DUF58 domain-containing protein n=1 Tax=Methanocella sp. MCL-LM TaxID=3412035 RepID=UPI003C720D55
MFSWLTYRTVAFFLLLLLAGVAMANMIFVYLSLIVLFYLVLSTSLNKPSGITIPETGSQSAWSGDTITIRHPAIVENGLGIVVVSDELPGHFSLAGGNNYHVYAKGFGRLEVPIEYSLVCTRRGVYQVPVAAIESIHFSGLEQTESKPGVSTMQLTVRPRPASIRRIPESTISSMLPLPLDAKCRTGMKLTDFREIRQYTPGDPYHSINWRATARVMQAPDTAPLVNDFEKEGRKTAWIFLDAREWMKAGSTVENAFEYAVQAALGISRFYLSRECRVGISFYNCNEPVLPDTGRRQSYLIARRLVEVEVLAVSPDTGTPPTLTGAVESVRGHLAGASPLFIVITMIEPRNASDLAGGIRSMRKFAPGRDASPSVMVLDIQGHSLSVRGEVEQVSAALVDLRNASPVRAIRKTGALVVPWNPQSHSLLQIMTFGLKRKMRGN